jgi:polyprenyl-phospho-N-acetylgalactosaminyl synthase
VTELLSVASPVMVVVPAYNEGSAVGPVVAELLGFGYGVVVVDDGSADDTGDVALDAGATVLRHPINRGQGAAIQTGLSYAVRTTACYVVTFDADGQHRAGDIETMVAALERENADVALGSRFLGEAPDIPSSRRALLKLAIAFTSLTEGLRLTDAHNGLRVFRREAAARIRIRRDGMAHASELIEEIRRLRLRWVEVPVTVRYTEYSKAKGQSGRNTLGILVELLVGKMR